MLKLPTHYSLRLFDPRDKQVGDPIMLPSLPPVGAAIFWEGRNWSIDQLQIIPASPGSFAEKLGEPALVHARVSRAEGIHD